MNFMKKNVETLSKSLKRGSIQLDQRIFRKVPNLRVLRRMAEIKAISWNERKKTNFAGFYRDGKELKYNQIENWYSVSCRVRKKKYLILEDLKDLMNLPTAGYFDYYSSGCQYIIKLFEIKEEEKKLGQETMLK